MTFKELAYHLKKKREVVGKKNNNKYNCQNWEIFNFLVIDQIILIKYWFDINFIEYYQIILSAPNVL